MPCKKESPRRLRNMAQVSERIRVFRIKKAAREAILEAEKRGDIKFIEAVKRNPEMVRLPHVYAHELRQVLDSVAPQR